MNKIQALHAFWNSFGMPAFDENTVPDEADRIKLYKSAFPYITYEMSSDSLGGVLAQSASLWYRSSSWADITAKEQTIADAISRGGRMITYDGGSLWLQRGTPWAQRMSDPSDENIRRIVMNVTVEFLD